ncbi:MULTISPECIES: hypothetical protein [Pasteurellaceae]|uniref:Uncharacterized protein n=1 Tax=Pasteurella bettyae CCUG 2042 TaxID=1095749 RepID=I3DJ48_9PAST|nr:MULTISPECIES: hypothetical protein [Pasteurellaceae]EIJ71741.1 hypothetical protein HMPREF1052_2157 [Pasteurella bettyae CCUG 2042]SUB20835.1 Uncharacterised protein [Pasteurella bettyae]
MDIEYEWLLIDDLDDEEPEKEEVEKIIKDSEWLEFDRKKTTILFRVKCRRRIIYA